MTADLLVIIALYIALGLLASILAALARIPLSAKLAIVLLVGASYFGSWHTWRALTGWPSEEALPDDFLFHSATIVEPDAKTGLGGAIYLWVTRLSADGPQGLPRAFHVPYERSTHEQIQAARERLREGHPQVGHRRRPEDGVDGPESQAADAHAQAAPAFTLRTAPVPALPEK
jgi:hypothetical protein